MYACLWCLEVFRPVGHTPFAQAWHSVLTSPVLHVSSAAMFWWHQHHLEVSLQGLHGPELPCFRDCRRWGDSWFMDPTQLHKVGLFSSFLPQEQASWPTTDSPGMRDLFDNLRSTALSTTRLQRAALGQHSFAAQSCFREEGVCSGRFAMTKPLWKRLSVNEKKESSLLFMSATEGPKQGVI